MAQHHKTIQQQLSHQIILADTLVKSVKEHQPSKLDCSDLATLAAQLAHHLRSTARLVSSSSSTTFYDRPLRSIFSNLSLNLERAQTLVRKCKQRSGILRQVFAITTAADVRKVSNLLESSIADIKWLLSVYVPDDNAGVNPSLPPIASNDPVLAWVWSNIATVHHSTQLKDRVDAANSLGSLAGVNNRNKKMIIQEEGIPPLLKLLKEGASPESQIAAAATLHAIATDGEKTSAFVRSMAIPTIVQVLNDSTSVVVRTNVINLVSKMADIDSWVQEEFGKENVMRPIVTFLANDIVLDDSITTTAGYQYHFSSSLSFNNKKETDVASPEEKLELKVSCARALWTLSKGSLSNSKKITETKALICLAKLIEHETEQLQINCLMTVTELAAVAESNPELRRQVFKPNLPAARTLLDQLLRVVNHEPNPKLVVPAITTIGYLARTFPAKETRILGPLVSKLDHEVSDVTNEAVMTLTKFVCTDNFNCVEHSKAILEFNGVPRVMGFLKSSDNIKIQVLGLELLCYLALNVGNSNVLEEARVLSVIEGGARSVVTLYPDMKELFANAVDHLNLYQPGVLTHKPAYVP